MVHVRSVVEPNGVVAAVRESARSLDPTVPVLGIETIESRRQKALQRERLLAVTAAAIGWVALALSAVGIFGRVNRDVVARTREIVIRSALGATPSQIARLFLADTARILFSSGLVGIGAALAAARVVEGQLYGVSGTGLTVYLGGAATLTVVAASATLLPLRRAWRAGVSTHLLRD